MVAVASSFAQISALIDRAAFARAIQQHAAERAAKGSGCWDHLVAMLFCQMGSAHSLREICGGLARAWASSSTSACDGRRRDPRWPMPMPIGRGDCTRRSSIRPSVSVNR